MSEATQIAIKLISERMEELERENGDLKAENKEQRDEIAALKGYTRL